MSTTQAPAPKLTNVGFKPATPRKLFVNIPVSDLQRSIDFFEKLGFTFNAQFTDATAPAMLTQRITSCLWFDNQAEAAASYYVGIFPNSRITATTRYPSAGQEVHHQQAGSVMVVAFELDGHTFTALNGGPIFTFNEAVSF